MPIVQCQHCEKKLKVCDELLGRSIRCPNCKEVIKVRARPTPKEDDGPRDEDQQLEQARPGKRRPKLKKKPTTAQTVISALAGGLGCIIATVLMSGLMRKDRSDRPPTEPAQVVQTKEEPVTFPDFSPSKLIQPGIEFQEATLKRGALPMKVWYYRPKGATQQLALVLVPPAGSTLIAGMDLGDGDRPEHFPYANAGFAVASFEIDGNVPPGAPDAQILKGAREFRDAKAGLANAKVALDFLLAKVDEIDQDRIYIAGHSSAATLALLVAEHDPRIKACAAYAPVSDVEARIAPGIAQLDRALPGYAEFIRFSSPKTHAAKLQCHLFLFHAEDDDNVPISQTLSFAELVKQTNQQVTLVTTAHGGHGESMIREGMPKGIAWLQGLK
jgi:dipeptidyl aminopeptidase/acylaminoacyl peptidase